MTTIKLSFRNIKKSFKDYAIYFFTLILGVAIFYVFNSIESQTVLLDVTNSTHKVIDLMTNMLSGASVFVAFILGFLIIYASRFLIKRRNKEFGIYMLLGMSKRKISMILFFETILIGIISLAVGLGLGVLLSQLMSMLVANMFEADMTKYEFIFSSQACIKTIIYFGIMYVIVMLFNTVNIGKCKLIDLIQTNKKSEKVKMKNPMLCTIVFIISAIALGYAYYMVTGGINETIKTPEDIFKPIVIGAVSTFFIFWSLSGLILKIVTSMKNLYVKGLNTFTFRQLSSKINTTVFSMTIISLMLFVTICVLSSALSLKNSMTANLDELAPADIQLEKRVLNEDWLDQGYNEEQIKNSKLSIREILEKFDFNIDSYLEESVEYNLYQTEELTFGDTLGDNWETIKNTYTSLIPYNVADDIMTISDYNKVAKFYGNEEYTINEDEYIIVADYDSMIEIRNVALKDNQEITVFGHTLKPKYNECQYGFVEMASNHMNSGIIIVPDDIVDDNYIVYNSIIGNYYTDSLDEQREIQEQIKNLVNNPISLEYNLPSINSKVDISEASIGTGALVTFLGLYLGIVFLIASVAILALKELTESTDNKERYNMLRKLGADEKMINKSLFRQIAIFFMFPLLIAIIHSIFGITFCSYIIETFGNEQLLPSIIMTAIFIVVFYGGYFLITYLSSKNIIKENRNAREY
ncbi:MAG TPA: ABC transporter permease [Candidatus Scatovivens faecipullorum]|nr:ABC transporter permease [Candidatus Scatovivens faecipullorum]